MRFHAAPSDPLAEVIALLQPRSAYSRTIEGAGRWAVRYGAFGLPSFCVVLEGGCQLAVQRQAPVELRQGDFVLLPATPGFVLSSLELGAIPVDLDAQQIAAQAARLDGGVGGDQPPDETLRHGNPEGPPDLRVLGGFFEFGSPDAGLLVSLLPAMLHVRDVPRLSLLVGQVGEETRTRRAGRTLVMTRFVELMLIEALRSAAEVDGRAEGAPPGLLRGLADPRLAQALRAMHAAPERRWTVVQLAAEAALSRSAFYERFSKALGLPPMEYLQAWRMALAKDLLRGQSMSVQQIAERVGYGSASTFSMAFSRVVGMAPGRFGRT
ncbi:AraC family transcriptional regulator [Aquincola tertiaricarbonis]|uniref:AraC family transcriptional regulator n=1 Tax=Aquincola tertiaricarbonis TaxID=391953 RepID=UPI000614C146|nr:AraC family transcriptional regulator [Aquincola tertiaricarbonis]